MIAPAFVDIPCPCGRRHHVPLSPEGIIRFICLSRRSVLTVRVPNIEKFHRALGSQALSEEALVREEGTCLVHKAAEPDRQDQQRCEDCGWLLVSYRSFLSLFGEQRARVMFWPTGSLVGRTRTGDYYLATEPLSAHRERRCFMRLV